jgi:hypothetical protein
MEGKTPFFLVSRFVPGHTFLEFPAQNYKEGLSFDQTNRVAAIIFCASTVKFVQIK